MKNIFFIGNTEYSKVIFEVDDEVEVVFGISILISGGTSCSRGTGCWEICAKRDWELEPSRGATGKLEREKLNEFYKEISC